MDDGGGTQAIPATPAGQVGELDILHGTTCWGGDGDNSMSSNECNKNLASVDHSDVTSPPSFTPQLFAGTPSSITMKSSDSCQAYGWQQMLNVT